MGRFILKNEISTIHGIVKVLSADLLHSAGRVQIESDIRVINGSTAVRGVHEIRAVGGWQCMQGEGVLALGPGQT